MIYLLVVFILDLQNGTFTLGGSMPDSGIVCGGNSFCVCHYLLDTSLPFVDCSKRKIKTLPEFSQYHKREHNGFISIKQQLSYIAN